MKTIKCCVSLFMAVVMVVCMLSVGIIHSSAASITDSLNSLSSQARYAPGSKAFGVGGCWNFVNEVSQKIFGVTIPGGTDGQYYLTGSHANWYCVKTLVSGNATNSAVLNLLKQAQAGDIIQYKSSYTNPQHTAMIYSVSTSGIVIYDSVSTGIRKVSYSWSNVVGSSGIGNFSSITGYGLSLYRCTKNVLQKPTVSVSVTGKTVKISWSDVGASSYYVYIHNVDTKENILGKNVGKTFSRTIELEPGDYKAHVTAVFTETSMSYGNKAFSITPEKYLVRFDANGGSGAPGTLTKTHGVNLKFPSIVPVREGYEFTGWIADKEIQCIYGPLSSTLTGNYIRKTLLSLSNVYYTTDSYVKFTAKWEPKSYTITYNANGGSNAPEVGEKLHDQTYTLSNEIPIREGYVFTGWATSSTGGASYQPGFNYVSNESVELFAVWRQESNAKITFSADKRVVKKGDIVKVSFSAKGGAYGWDAMGFSIAYDDAQLELIEAERAKVPAAWIELNSDINPILCSAVLPEGDYEGDILYLTFKVKEDVVTYEDIALTATVESMKGFNSQTQEFIDIIAPNSSYTVVLTVVENVNTEYGNVDFKNQVNAADALLALQIAVGKVVPTADQLIAADVDGNKVITAADALTILQYAVNKITAFPVELN